MSNITLNAIVESIFPDTLPSTNAILNKYPTRILPEGSMVTRFAPSPTGFLHIGGVFTALISERLAHQTNGVYIVRIEDTDQKRRIDGAENMISDGLAYFGLIPDEGWGSDCDSESVPYGPYKQSERRDIYRSFLKQMLLDGLAYPCFMTPDELDDMRARQSEMKVRPGYYGVWAKWRDADIKEVYDKLQNGDPYVLRYKSMGSAENKVAFDDLVKGKLEMQENDIDAVIMKSDGLPTYHLAHVIDDFLMHPTHVIRADEWIPSTPLHIQMTQSLGFKRIKYGHLSPITKIGDDGNKRKISKRKDPEANIEYYQKRGYPSVAVIEYLMNLASSSFEDWRKNNKDKKYTDYKLTFKALSAVSSPLFDENKLRYISKDIIASMSINNFFDSVLEWSRLYDGAFYRRLSENGEYWIKVFSIERIDGKRKDVASWDEVFDMNSYFDTDKFAAPDWDKFPTILNKDEVNKVKKLLDDNINNMTTADTFMTHMRFIAKTLGLAQNIKELKESNGTMRGHVGEVTQVIRYAVTGRTKSPDLFEIINVLGSEEVKRRLAI